MRRGSILAIGLAVGAVRCSGGGGAGVIPPAATVDLLDVHAQVLSARCALSGCHTGTGAPFGLDMSSVQSARANLVGVTSGEKPGFQRVQPNDAANSYIYMKLTADPRIGGDPMPLTGGPLSAADLALIRDWIEQGAM